MAGEGLGTRSLIPAADAFLVMSRGDLENKYLCPDTRIAVPPRSHGLNSDQ